MRKLFGEPSLSFRDRRENEKCLYAPCAFGDKDAAVFEAIKCFRLDDEMKRGQSLALQPEVKALVKLRIVAGRFYRPLRDHDSLVPCPVELRTDRRVVRHDIGPFARLPHRLSTEQDV